MIDAAEKHYPKHFPHGLGNQRHFELLRDKWETLISRCFSHRDSDINACPSTSTPHACGVSPLSGDEIARAGGKFARILADISWFQPTGVGTYLCCFKNHLFCSWGLVNLVRVKPASAYCLFDFSRLQV